MLRTLLIIATSLLIAALGSQLRPALAQSSVQVWLAPDNDSPDLLALFEKPNLWEHARSQISVLKLGPQQLGGNNTTGLNTLEDLAKVGAFQLLKSWGISLALEVPTGCDPEAMAQHTLYLVTMARKAGAIVETVSMTGLLAASACQGPIDPTQAAIKTAAFMRHVHASEPALKIGDIEPYPSESPAQIGEWLSQLKSAGTVPAYLHLDANVHFLDVHPEIDVPADFRALSTLLHGAGIDYGIIFWGGYDPEPTDQAFFAHTMSWVRRVHAAIGIPDHAIFQSWIRRSYPACTTPSPTCGWPRLLCPLVGAPGCGLKSIPVNLPEADPNVFSLTRLVDQALPALRSK